jgi:hypothetical protein
MAGEVEVAATAEEGEPPSLPAFLESVGMSQHLSMLQDENEMDLATLRVCQAADLEALGLPPADAAVILQAAQNDEREGEGEDENGGGVGGAALPVYRCVRKAALRVGLSMFSPKCNRSLQPGDLIEILDTQVLHMGGKEVVRVRCVLGWCSVTSMAGFPLLEGAEGEAPSISTSDDEGVVHFEEKEEADGPSCGCCSCICALIRYLLCACRPATVRVCEPGAPLNG